MSCDFENTPDMNSNCQEQPNDYLQRAAEACASGDSMLGMHLYLAAFETSARNGMPAEQDPVVAGLKKAWALACQNKERSIAEYIFSKLSPYLNKAEMDACGAQLQDLAFDKLEEIGIRRGDLEEIAQTITHDVLGLEGQASVHIDSIKPYGFVLPASAQQAMQKMFEGPTVQQPVAMQDAPCSNQCSCEHQPTGSKDAHPDVSTKDVVPSLADLPIELPEQAFTYKSLVGYGETVKVMRKLGVGMDDDPEHKKLVALLNAKHGLETAPAPDALLFRSPAREDANRFMEATLGELGVPGVRMHIEENWQGLLMLCLSAQKSKEFTFDTRASRFTGRGALLLENIDLWDFPQPSFDSEDGLGAFVAAQASRGAREAVNLIRTAVEDPDVYVLATASSEGPIEPFLLEILGPFTEIDIDYPTPGERADLWIDLARKHPSIRGVNRVSLVRFSEHLARYDIVMAAREAIEDAYKQGLRQGAYSPVHSYDLFEKLAAYHPLDSKEYAELEEAMVRDFAHGLNVNDPLLGGE